jgi:hypothetical protein
MTKQVRQGDVLLVKIGELPKDAKLSEKKGDIILAYGEVTGHAHRIAEGTASLYEWQGNELVQIKEPTYLTHEEHASIALEPGVWKKVQQVEYSPEAENFTRYVVD